MPRGNYTIQRSCEECGKIFTPPTLMSKYCCPACSKRAYKKRQIAKEKEAIRQALVRRIPSNKGYLTVKESMLIYGISKDVLYRMIRQGLIPSYNFGQRLTRLSRQYMDEHFKTKVGSRKRKKEALSFEPKDCYTIGEIAKKFHINDSWKIQCKLPPKTKRFCPLKTFNNAPLKSLDRWGYYYFNPLAELKR